MVHRVRCYIKGYVRVLLKGKEILRLFNMCKTHGIVLRKITHEEDGVCCNVLVSDFSAILPLLKKTGTKIRVIKKAGLPFLIRKIRRRLCFCLCLFGCLFLLNMVDSYVWAIEYIGNSRISNDELRDFIQLQNIYYGMPKANLQMEELEKNLRKEFSIVTWTSIYLEGTKLCVEIKENEVKQYEKETVSEGSNLVATEAGTVTSIITRSGVPKVKTGDVVEEGQILVEGLVPVYDEALSVIDYQIYDADADVYVNTLIPYSDYIDREYTVMDYTGRVQNCFFIEAGGKRYEIPGFMKKFDLYEKISQKWQSSILEDIYLPLFYGTVIYKEYQLCYLEHTPNELEAMLYDNFRHFMETLEGKGVQIIEKNVKIGNDTESMYLKGELLVNKKTGTRGAIDSLLLKSVADEDILEGAAGTQEE